MARRPAAPYLDPLDRVWLAAANRIGLDVERSEEVYASTDGAGTLAIGDEQFLDQDDSLAQMIFHELCHSLIEGPESFERPDWGLDNETTRDTPREHACLRVQAALAAPRGLRWFFAPTTDHRAFYDALPDNPLDAPDDRSTMLARIGLSRASRLPWAPALIEALDATAVIVGEAASIAGAEPSLYDTVEAPWPPHPTCSFRVAPYFPDERCGTCGWYDGEDKTCRQADAGVDHAWPACERWEPTLDCLTCAACCGPAYDTVELADDEPIVGLKPDLVIRREGRIELKRIDGRCAALAAEAPHTCAIYANRPRTCSGFDLAGEHCLTARRRVGLSR